MTNVFSGVGSTTKQLAQPPTSYIQDKLPVMSYIGLLVISIIIVITIIIINKNNNNNNYYYCYIYIYIYPFTYWLCPLVRIPHMRATERRGWVLPAISTPAAELTRPTPIRTTTVISLASWYISPTVKLWLYGYGSIPINTIFRGMNIHLPAILMFTRGTRFWPIPIYPLITAPSSWVSGILGIVEVWDGKASVDRFKWFNGWAPATTRCFMMFQFARNIKKHESHEPQ